MKSKSPFSIPRLFVTGFFMGMADLIPGVSGGTVAFISGIYEELLYSIKIVSGKAIKLGLEFKIKEMMQAIPFRFLLPLFAGIFTAVLSLARMLSFLLDEFPIYTWSLFFGLVLASTWLVAKRVKIWNNNKIFTFVIFTIIGYILVGAVPVETAATILMFFLGGMLAIIAMILPGISGSFILLIIGKYTQVLTAVKELNILPLVAVLLGTVVGLSFFSRMLSWLFAKHHDVSIAALTGFMLGSLRKLWPWKETILTRINSHGEVVPLVEHDILPNTFGLSVIFAIALIMLGVGIIIFIERLELVKEEHSLTPSPT